MTVVMAIPGGAAGSGAASWVPLSVASATGGGEVGVDVGALKLVGCIKALCLLLPISREAIFC